MSDGIGSSHAGFLRRSMIYVVLNGFTSIVELGFAWVTVRLPDNGYSTFWALLKLFFIVTAPLSAFQFVVTKEVAAFSVLGQYGKRRFFFVRTVQYCLFFAIVIIACGMPVSGIIGRSLNIDGRLPVLLLFLTIGFYFPIPIMYGAVQGLKKFVAFGFMQMSWGFLRLVFGAVVVFFLAGGLSGFMTAVIAATLITAVISYFPTRTLFDYPVEKIEKKELTHAYSLVVPIILTLFSMTVMKNVDVVLAKGYFTPGEADAYTCAATVGSAFFILSAIFMVMFPMVSEEKTRGGNPIMFLFKSCGFVLVLSSVGLVIAVTVPEVPMYVFTLGKRIPGALPLIRLIGFAIVPVALVNIMSNYFLAKHQWRFIPIIVGGMILQIIMIVFNHATPVRMIWGIIAANTLTMLAMAVYLLYEHKRFVGTLSTVDTAVQ